MLDSSFFPESEEVVEERLLLLELSACSCGNEVAEGTEDETESMLACSAMSSLVLWI